ncbi:MAG: hypothetical protein ACREAE_05585 [Nitrosopumilaceae archaeon]
MFDFLSNVSSSLAVNGVYCAVRIINRRTNFQVEKLNEQFQEPSIELSSDERELALRVIDEIQGVEKGSLASLDEKKADKYITQLTNIVQRQIKRELNYDIKRGDRLLAKLRYAQSPTMQSSRKSWMRRS